MVSSSAAFGTSDLCRRSVILSFTATDNITPSDEIRISIRMSQCTAEGFAKRAMLVIAWLSSAVQRWAKFFVVK